MSEDLSISDDVMEQMCAAAFRSLCEHLRQRSDEVQNIDLMSISGFCRNCLAKWMVLEARKLSKQLVDDKSFATIFIGNSDQVCTQTIHDLNAFGYDEAAKEVYGSTISEWKKHHQKKATDVQMRLYKESIKLHATHDAELLKKVDDDNTNTTTNNLSEKIMIRLQAGAFNSLCHHLRVRSDTVQNLELMTISGFCRNCLAKWLVVEARAISDKISADDTVAASYFPEQQKHIINSLDSFGYDDAAKYVYGCTYSEWKKRHQKKSTDEQMERYNASKSIHAKHDKELLATRASSTLKEPTTTTTEHISKPQICVNKPQSSLLSDVCCQDVDAIDAVTTDNTQTAVMSIARPPRGKTDLKIGILTVSDRASKNMYETGDLSGPAVETTVTTQMHSMNSSFSDQRISISHVVKYIVPDDHNAIKEVLLSWSSSEQSTNTNIPRGECDLIFTTGGTGFSNRDVTPEATLDILDRECQGLMPWATMVLTTKQPLATLSRAAAGTIGNTLIVNLPGNPLGAAQVVEILFPLLLHAIKDIQTGKMDVLV